MSVDIPDKTFFRIGEAARIIGVEPHVLRFWETEFSGVRPERSDSSHRVYKRRQLEMFLEIKRLLHEELYTIAGARRKLKQRPMEPPRQETIEDIRQGLMEIKSLLENS